MNIPTMTKFYLILQLELFPQFTSQIRRPRQSCQADCLLELHLKNIPIMQNRLAFPLTKYPSAQPFSQSYKGLPLKHTNLSRFEISRTHFHIPAFSYIPVYPEPQSRPLCHTLLAIRSRPRIHYGTATGPLMDLIRCDSWKKSYPR